MLQRRAPPRAWAWPGASGASIRRGRQPRRHGPDGISHRRCVRVEQQDVVRAPPRERARVAETQLAQDRVIAAGEAEILPPRHQLHSSELRRDHRSAAVRRRVIQHPDRAVQLRGKRQARRGGPQALSQQIAHVVAHDNHCQAARHACSLDGLTPAQRATVHGVPTETLIRSTSLLATATNSWIRPPHQKLVPTGGVASNRMQPLTWPRLPGSR